MGLKLIKNNHGEYRRIWYANMHVNGTAQLTSHKLKTPLRGKIPLDENGRFSLNLIGDDAFEKSKAAATAEWKDILDATRQMKAEERTSPGYVEREVYRKLMGKPFESIRIADLPERNAQRTRYEITGNKRECRYNRSVYDILTGFARHCSHYSQGKPKSQRCEYITDINQDVVAAYYADISKKQSWQTFRKCVFICASVYQYFMPKGSENPFKKVYEDGFKGKKSPIDKTCISHEAPTEEQMWKVFDYARNETDKPYLHRLVVVAACTGMRIGDCCNLTWDKVDLLNNRITTKTAKTGKNIAVPVLYPERGTADHHEILGELHRELESAVVERKDGEKYVIPEAAAIYNRDPSRINKIGKMLFARALFSAPEPEDAVIVGEEPKKKTPVQVMRIIENATMKPERKERLLRTYELHIKGKSYRQIAEAVGNRKGNVSEDLGTIEELIGERLRPGNPYMGANAKPSLKTLLKKTRRERAQGQRAGCLYGWHSCRVFFVVTAINAGIKPDDLKYIVGHSTVRMVLHYYNPEEFAAAEKMRAQFRRNRMELDASRSPQLKNALPMEDALADARRAILESPTMTQEAKEKALAALILLSLPTK